MRQNGVSYNILLLTSTDYRAVYISIARYNANVNLIFRMQMVLWFTHFTFT